MKRAKKSTRKAFAFSGLEIHRARMQAYMARTQENFRRIIAEATNRKMEAPQNAASPILEHVTPVGGNVFLDRGFSAEEAAQLKKETDKLIDRERQGHPES